MDIINILLDSLKFGIPYGFLALGLFVSYRILDFADLTTEASYVLGGAISLLLISQGVNPYVATIFAIIFGFIAGCVTGMLHTFLKIPGLLAGIITMTGLFSVNMVIMGLGKKGVGFFEKYNSMINITYNGNENDPTIYSIFSNLFDVRSYYIVFALILFVIIMFLVIYYFFGTEIGMSMRATGMNPKMARAQGINTNLMIILGLAMANSIIALGGALGAQRDLNVSTSTGPGTIVIGLAAIIIGEAVFGRKTFKNWLLSVILGAIIYYLIIAIAVYLGFPSHLLKLLYSILIVIVLSIPLMKKGGVKNA